MKTERQLCRFAKTPSWRKNRLTDMIGYEDKPVSTIPWHSCMKLVASMAIMGGDTGMMSPGTVAAWMYSRMRVGYPQLTPLQRLSGTIKLLMPGSLLSKCGDVSMFLWNASDVNRADGESPFMQDANSRLTLGNCMVLVMSPPMGPWRYAPQQKSFPLVCVGLITRLR